MTRKNNAFQNKIKNMSNNIIKNTKDYSSLSVIKFNKNSYLLLTESDKKQLNINFIILKKKKYRGCTHNEKLLKIIKEKYLFKKIKKKIAADSKNNKIEVLNLREKNDYKENNNNDSNNKNCKCYII